MTYQGQLSPRENRWLRLVGPTCLLLLWYAYADLWRGHSSVLPSLIETIRRLVELTLHGSLATETAWTAYRWLFGYLLAVVVGVPLGLLLGTFRRLYVSSEFLLDFFRSLPVTSLFPIYLLIWGVLGEGSKRAMIFTAAVFPIIIATTYGVWQSNPARTEMARVFGATRWQIFTRITFWEAMGAATIGMRTALSVALVVCVLTELWIGTEHGIGVRLFDAYSRGATADMFVMVLVLGFLGYFANQAFLRMERKVVFWTGH